MGAGYIRAMLAPHRLLLAGALAALAFGCATAPSHEDAASVGTCATLRAKLTRLVAARDPSLVSWAVDKLFVCAERDGWAWAFDVQWIAVSGESDGSQTLIGDGNIVRVAPDGSQVGTLRAFHNGTESYGAVTDIEFVDLDPDTIPEAVVRSRFDRDEAGRKRIEVFAVNGLYIYEMSRLWGATVIDLRDGDGDGRADLIITPYSATERGCGTTDRLQPVLGPSLLLHATATGFAVDDASLAFARKQCAVPPTPPYRDGDDIACARMWNVPAADVLASLAETCLTYGDVCHDIGLRPQDVADARELVVPAQCPAWYEAWAMLEPWVRFRR